MLKGTTRGGAALLSDDNKKSPCTEKMLFPKRLLPSSRKELRHTAHFLSPSSATFPAGTKLAPEPCLLHHASPPPAALILASPCCFAPAGPARVGKAEITVTASLGKLRGPRKVHCENECACSLITFCIRSATRCQIKTWPTTHFSCSHSYKLVH